MIVFLEVSIVILAFLLFIISLWENVSLRYVFTVICTISLLVLSISLGSLIEKKDMTAKILSGKIKVTEKSIKVLEENK